MPSWVSPNPSECRVSAIKKWGALHLTLLIEPNFGIKLLKICNIFIEIQFDQDRIFKSGPVLSII